MTTIFSSNFYQQNFFLNEVKPFIENEMVDLVLSSRPDSSLFSRIRAFFLFKPDSDLFAISQKLNEIFDEIKKPNSEMARKLIEELHREGNTGYQNLLSNLESVKRVFQIENKRSSFARFCLSISNIFRTIFNYPLLQEPQHSLISYRQWKDVLKPLKREAFQLTAEESNQTKFFMEIKGPSPVSLTAENMNKLQCGFIPALIFEHGSNKYRLNYKKDKQAFHLGLVSGPEPRSLKESRVFLNPPAEFVNKGPLRYSVEIKGNREDWEGTANLWMEWEFKKSFFQGSSGSFKSSGHLVLETDTDYTLSCEGEAPLILTLKQK
ncbi:hypothetical protein [Candidatus Protochlamydia phocaeensis]|uniref:hypothetical protein n=1 Tax=Candidatus Protochlamydia phocaeensis TaxID=1414722 RepID=UPI0012AB95B9|nr:hypothetical protein [Candidatus Protochlamydia phocaeensis]